MPRSGSSRPRDSARRGARPRSGWRRTPRGCPRERRWAMLPGLELRDPGFAILFLVPPALLAASLWRRRRRSRDAAIRYSNLGPFRGLPPTARLRLRHLVPVLRAAGLGLLVVALLRPQKGSELAPETAQGVSILMAVDRSGSMETPDFQLGSKKVSRLEEIGRAACRGRVEISV